MKILIITQYSPGGKGGIHQMRKLVEQHSRKLNHKITLAWYLPHSVNPSTSVRFWQIFHKKVSSQKIIDSNGIHIHEIGAFLPELEFLHYWPNNRWKSLIDSHDHIVCACGSVLPALACIYSRKKTKVWVATGLWDETKTRISGKTLSRKILTFINLPFNLGLEMILSRIFPLFTISKYSQAVFQRISGRNVEYLPVPYSPFYSFTQIGKFHKPEFKGRICFTGRFTDPRKNISLLIKAFALCYNQLPSPKLILAGAKPTAKISSLIKELGIIDLVEIHFDCNQNDLKNIYLQCDLFVIPSLQEGLCISALEAMACGCIPISTSCGGPEEFVLDNQTGKIFNSTPRELAEKILEFSRNLDFFQELSKNAIKMAESNYSSHSVNTNRFIPLLSPST